MMPRRIRILAGRLSDGVGSHNYNRELAGRLAARGHRVSVVCFEGHESLRERARQIEIPRHGYSGYRLVWRYAAWLEWIHAGREIGRAPMDEADVVIAAEHLFIRGHAKRFPATPIIYLPHSLLVSHEIESYGLLPAMHRSTLAVYTRTQRWALANAAATLRFTRGACDMLQAAQRGPVASRFVVNPIGVRIPEPTPRTRGTSEPLRLLYVGQLIPRKRVDVILRALSRCQRFGWTLDVVGDGPSRVELESLSAGLDLSSRVRFHGRQPGANRWYAESDLFVFTSQSESLGLVLFEAMSHGVPCLALRSDGKSSWNVNDEIIEHGRTGILAEGESGFATELESVLGSPSKLTPMGQAAREHVIRHHSWDAHLDRYESLFDELRPEASSHSVRRAS